MRRKMIIMAITVIMTGTLQTTYGQDRKLIRKGNELYKDQKYKEAVTYYQQALTKNPTSVTGMFNLGNAYYKQKQTDAARQVMTAAARQSKDSLQRAAAQYNLGNTYMDEQKWEEAIESYKQTLRDNPRDEEARYNLSYARAMLKQQEQQGGGNDNKDQQDDKDKKDNQQQQQQDQQDDKKKDKQQDKQDQQQQDQKEEEQQQRSQPMPSKLSEQQAEQILNALQQEEKNLQDKQQKEKGVPVKIEKDW